MTLSRIALMGGPVYDSDAKAVFTSLVQAGVTLSFAHKRAINAFIRGEKAAGRWSALKLLNLPIWGLAAANAINWITRASGTFSGSVTHASGYIQGDGSTGYFNSGLSPSSAGMTSGLGTEFALLTNLPGSGSFIPIGSTDGTRVTALELSTTTITGYNHAVSGTAASLSLARASQGGIVYACRTSTTAHITKRLATAGTSAGSNNGSTSSTSGSTANCFSLAYNNNGTPVNFYSGRLGANGMAIYASVADADAAMAALKTLWESLTGLTLP